MLINLFLAGLDDGFTCTRCGNHTAIETFGQETQQLDRKDYDDASDRDAAKTEHHFRKARPVSMYDTVVETAGHLHAGKKNQRVSLAADNGDVHLRESTENDHARGSRDHSTRFAETGVEKNSQRHHVTEQNLSHPEQLGMNSPIHQDETFNTVVLGEIQVGQVIHGNKIKHSSDEDDLQTLQP